MLWFKCIRSGICHEIHEIRKFIIDRGMIILAEISLCVFGYLQVAPWEPYQYVTQMETDSAVVPPGGFAVYNVTIGIPYRTVTDIEVEIKSTDDAIQVHLYNLQSFR